MPGSGIATITAKTGPGIQNTSIVINDATGFNFDLYEMVLYIKMPDGKIKEYSLTGVTTVTLTISGTVFTLTVS